MQQQLGDISCYTHNYMTVCCYPGLGCSLADAPRPADRPVDRPGIYEAERTAALSLIIRKVLVVGSPALVCWAARLVSCRREYKVFRPY